jgi:hypothetical protein
VRRICLFAAAIAASSIAVAVAVAPAGAKVHKTHTRTEKVKTTLPAVKIAGTCSVNESIAVPTGSSDVVTPVSSGTLYGSSHCGSPLGGGIEASTMALQDSGDLTGNWTHYLRDGSISGTYDWTQSQSQPSSLQTFNAASYTGTLVVTGGTAKYHGATGKGTSTCNSPDSVHFQCSETLKVTLPPVTVIVTKTVTVH